MAVEIDDLESTRFGIIAAKLTSDEMELSEVNRFAQKNRVQMVTARTSVDNFKRVHNLEEDGYRLMDTLVYYKWDVRDVPVPRPLPDGITLRRAVPNDNAQVAGVAACSFSSYLGHYHTDPRLDDTAADAAYVEWAETQIQNLDVKNPVTVAVINNSIIGFIIPQKNSNEELEIILNAVHPDHQRGGIYSQLITKVMSDAKKLKFKRIMISTQVNNYDVQRVWSRLGFFHFQSFYTFHKWFG